MVVDRENRLDIFLSEKLNEPRSQVSKLIKSGNVKVDDKVITKTGFKLKQTQKIDINFPDIEEKEYKKVDFDIDIIYEDDDVLVINKPKNLVIHPAPSVKEATLVDWLKAKNISLSNINGEERHGIVHRIDKDTTGALVVAKNNESHIKLSQQLQDKTMGRIYLAIIDMPLKEDIIIDKPIGRNPKNRLKMAVVGGGKEAKTAFIKLLTSKNKKYELIAAKLFTGRTHQIRVHLSSINRHILGDETYGFKNKNDIIERVFLHAYIMYFIHPKTNKFMTFMAPLKEDMQKFLNNNFDMEIMNEKINKDYIFHTFDSFIK